MRMTEWRQRQRDGQLPGKAHNSQLPRLLAQAPAEDAVEAVGGALWQQR